MNFKHYLEEGRDAPLYHGTSRGKADLIIKDNILRDYTHQMIGGKRIYGVSLTRNFDFASVFRSTMAVFELDQRKLAQRYKIQPYDWYFRDGSPSEKRRTTKIEYEEFLAGTIMNLNKYITKIHIYENESETDNQDMSELLNHPLLWDHQHKKWVNK